MVGDISTDTLERVEQSPTANLITEQPEVYETDKTIDSPNIQNCLAKLILPGNILNVVADHCRKHCTTSQCQYIISRVPLECVKCIALFNKEDRLVYANETGIPLFLVAGNVFPRVFLNSLTVRIANQLLKLKVFYMLKKHRRNNYCVSLAMTCTKKKTFNSFHAALWS